MADLDRKLFATHSSVGYAEREWQEIIDNLLAKLDTFLEQPVTVSDVQFYPDGLAGDISSREPFAGLLRLSWFGRIGVTVVGDREATEVEAIVFLRSAGKRLVAIDGEGYLWLRYTELAPEVYDWTAPKWLPDEYGEYESWV